MHGGMAMAFCLPNLLARSACDHGHDHPYGHMHIAVLSSLQVGDSEAPLEEPSRLD